MRFTLVVAVVLTLPCLVASQACAAVNETMLAGTGHPGCEHATPHACVGFAMAAMGGASKLAAIRNEQLDIVEHRPLAEQSYRQAPFLTSYARVQRLVDFDQGLVSNEVHGLWPESDLGTAAAESDSTVVASARAAVIRTKQGDRPARQSSVDDARAILALGLERLLLSADAASDLRYLPDEMVRSTPHTVVAFDWHGAPVKVLLNGFNHLPDAVESTRPFDDFWFAWGDVTQRVYFSNWKVVQGVVFPTSRIEERNGTQWVSSQILDAKFNVPMNGKSFVMNSAAAAQSVTPVGWDIPFSVTKHIVLAPGIDLYQGPWSMTFIRQKDGVLVLEAPISPHFVKGGLEMEHKLYPHLPVKGVLTTSDSWPHIAGVREAVADKLPVYALDLNLPLLKRMVAAPHTLRLDDLQRHPELAHWVPVSHALPIGNGPNRVVLYPLRGASTGRQYMVYFPGRKLLYASDTLVLEPGGKLYDPELMHEVVQAVHREHLSVDTVYAMHQGPTPWQKVAQLVAAATHG
jgi:hypothetical protein